MRRKLWIILVVVSLIGTWLLLKPRMILYLQGSFREELEHKKEQEAEAARKTAEELEFQELLENAPPLDERDLKCFRPY